jgi:hypothetical protein
MEKDRRQRPRLEIYARSRSPGVHALRTESYLLCPKKVPGRPPLCLVEGTRGRRLVPKQLRFSPLKIRLRRWSIRHDDDRPRSTHSHTHEICASLTLASLDQASAGRAADETLPRFSLWLCSERMCSSAVLPEVSLGFSSCKHVRSRKQARFQLLQPDSRGSAPRNGADPPDPGSSCRP